MKQKKTQKQPRIPRGWAIVKNGRLIREGDKWWPSEIPASCTVGEKLSGYGTLIRRIRSATPQPARR